MGNKPTRTVVEYVKPEMSTCPTCGSKFHAGSFCVLCERKESRNAQMEQQKEFERKMEQLRQQSAEERKEYKQEQARKEEAFQTQMQKLHEQRMEEDEKRAERERQREDARLEKEKERDAQITSLIQTIAETNSKADAEMEEALRLEREAKSNLERALEEAANATEEAKEEAEQNRIAAEEQQRIAIERKKEALQSKKEKLEAQIDGLEAQKQRSEEEKDQLSFQIEELTERIEDEVQNPAIGKFTREEKDGSIYKTIVLMGETGCGKSTLTNRFLGDESHLGREGPCKITAKKESCTSHPAKYPTEAHGQKIVVVDTPGLSDSFGRDASHVNKIITFLKTSGGVNAFFMVMKVTDRLTWNQQQILRELACNLGDEFANFFYFILTYVDDNSYTADESLESSCEELPVMIETTFGFPLPRERIFPMGFGDGWKTKIQTILENVPGERFVCDRLVSPVEKWQSELDDKQRLVRKREDECSDLEQQIAELGSELVKVLQELDSS